MQTALNLNQTTTASAKSSHVLSGDFGTSIYSAVDAVVAMLEQSNLVKVDPAKLREVLDASKGRLSVGSWRADGEKRAEEATELAMSRVFPRVVDYGNVTAAIISISGSPDMGMNEYDVIVKMILGKLPDNASVLMGVNTVESWQDSIQVTVLLGGV